MNEDNAELTGEQILSDNPNFDDAVFQTTGQADNPHGDPEHNDGWYAYRTEDGDVGIDKVHATGKNDDTRD